MSGCSFGCVFSQLSSPQSGHCWFDLDLLDQDIAGKVYETS